MKPKLATLHRGCDEHRKCPNHQNYVTRDTSTRGITKRTKSVSISEASRSNKEKENGKSISMKLSIGIQQYFGAQQRITDQREAEFTASHD